MGSVTRGIDAATDVVQTSWDTSAVGVQSNGARERSVLCVVEGDQILDREARTGTEEDRSGVWTQALGGGCWRQWTRVCGWDLTVLCLHSDVNTQKHLFVPGVTWPLSLGSKLPGKRKGCPLS